MFTESAPEADYSALPTAIFTDPELAAIGLTEQEARDDGFDVESVTHPLSAVTRAQYTDSKRGLYKLVFERGSRRVLGVHVVNRAASEIVQGLALRAQARRDGRRPGLRPPHLPEPRRGREGGGREGGSLATGVDSRQ